MELAFFINCLGNCSGDIEVKWHYSWSGNFNMTLYKRFIQDHTLLGMSLFLSTSVDHTEATLEEKTDQAW